MKLLLAAAGLATGTATGAALSVSPCLAEHSKPAAWEFAGPSTYVTRGDSPAVSSAGAAQNVAGGANNSWFLGSVNGGVWRSKSIGRASPHWENVLDGQPVTCASISALHVSGQDPSRVYAGCGGSTSSEQGADWNVMNSGDWAGIMMSPDGGDTWRMMDGFPANYYVTDILEPSEDTLLVSAQSHLYDRDDGGIWFSDNRGLSFTRVDTTPTFTMTLLPSNAVQGAGGILATHARSEERSISLSTDGGKTFEDFGRLEWDAGAAPFYTCATAMGDGSIVVAGLTRHSGLPNNTNSQFFVRSAVNKTLASTSDWVPLDQPTSMDEDSMPKDRMAVMGDPELGDLMYVAGNAGALAWRVNVTTGKWTKMWDKPDVVDDSIPHGDCRNYAWDSADGRLLLVSDGGIFARELPRTAGGKWLSLNGDYSSMELLSAHYDWRDDRYIAGAQDNCAQVTPVNSTAHDVALGFVEGDGTVTLVDSNVEPSRLFGTTQFLGVGTIDIDPSVSDSVGDDDDGCGGLCFVQGDKFINVPIDKYFPEPASFPFFVQPYALNSLDTTRLVFWANGTGTRTSAFYEFSIPYSVKEAHEIAPPTRISETPEDSFFLDFVAGGVSNGVEDPSLIVGISNTHLYRRSNATENGDFVAHPLPVRFAKPVTLEYDPAQQGARILGPVTHGRTVSLTVSPSNSDIVAVTGWPSVSNNAGDEVVFLTQDGGHTWTNVTGNLRDASGVVGKVRPGGVLIVDLQNSTETDSTEHALLVGTSSGVLTTFFNNDALAAKHHPSRGMATRAGKQLDSSQKWSRLGSCDEFPIVLTADVDYEPHSDRLVAATFGRGIYTLKHAREALLGARDA